MIQTNNVNLQSATPAKTGPVAPGAQPKNETTPQDHVELGATPPLRTPRPGSEMAEMLETLEQAKERHRAVGNDLEKAVLSDIKATGGVVFMRDEEPVREQPQHSATIDGFLTQFLPASAHAKHAPNNAMMGGHLGIEGGEQVLHHMSHAGDHAVGAVGGHAAEVASHAAGVKGHTLEVASHAATVKGHAAEVTSHAATVKGHAAEVASHATEVKGHAAEVASNAASAKGYAAETAQEIANSQIDVASSHTAEAAQHASTAMEVASGVLGAASGGLGAVMIYFGLKDVKKGIKEKDVEHGLEGVGNVAVGARSVAAGTILASHAVHAPVLAEIAGVAKSTLGPLGVIHGGIDAGLGVKDIVVGVRDGDRDQVIKGGLNVGMGSALIATAALGAGPIGLAVAGGFLVGKVAHSVIAHRRQAREAAAGTEEH